MKELIDQLLPILTIVGQVAVVVMIIGIIWEKSTKKKNVITEFFSSNGLLIAFLAALISTLGSLFYSEIMGYEPCKLCWFQRIVMYPQVITLGIAMWKKDSRADLAGYALSIIGVVIATYHYLGQIAVVSDLPCSAIGYSQSCSQRFVLDYGYITIPMMAITGFLLIIFGLLSKNLSK